MYTHYKISTIIENEKETIVTARIMEGDYDNILDETTQKAKSVYVGKGFIKNVTLSFPAKTSREEISKKLKEQLSEDKTRTALWK